MADVRQTESGEPLNEVNVIPLADLSLVLLIILMVLSPMIMQSMIKVQSSRASAVKSLAEKPKEPPIILALNRNGVTLNTVKVIDDVDLAARLSQADEFICELPRGYDTVLGERGVTLSGGQRQRLALARALIGNPRVLILDDATSSVDATVEAAILEGLRRELRTTLIVIACRMPWLSSFSLNGSAGSIQLTGISDMDRSPPR